MPPGSVAALRRSSRLKAKAKAKTPSNAADASQGPEAGSKVVVLRDSDRSKRPVKRRRVKTGTQVKQQSSATRDRAGMGLKSESLSMLPDMPRDILYEVSINSGYGGSSSTEDFLNPARSFSTCSPLICYTSQGQRRRCASSS